MGPKTDKVSTFKIYVTNLPESIKNEDVAKLFEPYGRVVESEVFRGNYAFVHMEDDENGKRAMEELNGKEIDEQVINVCQSKNLQGPKIATMKLAVKNIPTGFSAGELRNLFVKYGYVLEAEVRGANGHVLLEATGDIRSAINEVSACEIRGSTLKVEAVTNYTPNPPAQSTPKSSKLLGKRKEPAGPSGRSSGYGPPLPHPPPLAYPGYPPRRPGPPPPGPPRGRLMPPPCQGPPRPRPMPPPMMRPYYAGRPPAYEDDFNEAFPRYRNNRQDFSDDYEETPPPFYQPGPAPPHRRPQPPQYYEDEPLYEPEPYRPRAGPGPLAPPVPLFSKPKRIARNRPPPTPSFGPRPLFDEPGPSYPPENPEEDFYNDYEVYQPPPIRPTRPQRPPPPLLAPPAVPNPSVRTAKVTKFGKIVIEGGSSSNSNGVKAAVGAEKVKHRGVRGGVKVKARKAAIMAAMSSSNKGQGKHLPSLLDPIPGTVRVVGDQRNPLGPPPLRGPGRNSQAMGAGPRPLMGPSRPPVPLLRAPRNLPRQSGPKPNNSQLSLYQRSKVTAPVNQHHQSIMVPAAAPVQPEIDFTADIELP